MLTRKQQELLTFIHDSLKKNGVSPSFDEMKAAINLKSKSGIHRLISGLEERGFIKRLANRARALEVVRLPESLTPLAKNAAQVVASVKNALHSAIPLPMLGRIAAGVAIEAIRDDAKTMDIPANLLGRGEHYVLEVAGDSMMDAGILDGDSVVIQKCDTADNGAIVVALVDEDAEAQLLL